MPRRPSAVRMFNTPTTARGLDATKGVLPSGGKLDDSAKSKGRVVDSSVSHVDRHRIHLLRKPNDTSNMFVPLEPKAYDPSVSRGVNLHTDPFDEGRARITFKKAKAKVATPRGPERAERRHLRQCDLPKNEGAKDGFIVANGIRHTSPKRVYQERHSTTHQLEQPPKSFKNAQRFFFSPYKGGRPLVQQPGMFLPENSVEAPAALKESKESPASLPITASTQSGARTYRALSNAFFDTSAPPPPAVEDRRRAGVRQFAAVTQAPTMEGVFTPMRDGRVPRPQAAEAPWTRMEQQPHPHGVRMLSARQAGEVPYAIEW